MPALTQKKKSPINLLPHNEEEKTFTARIINWLLTTFRFLVITVELVVIIGFLSRFFLDSKNSDLSDEINQKKALIASYLPFEKEFKTVQERIAATKETYNNPIPFTQIIGVVTKNITADLTLVSISKSASGVEISVDGESEQSISTFVSKLKADNVFKNVEVTAIEGIPLSNLVRASIRGSIPI